MKWLISTIIISIAFLFFPGKITAQQKLAIVLEHRVGDQKLSLGDSAKTILGDMIVVERFRYYLSNFSITDQQGKTTILTPQYFLVDESDSLSKRIELNIPTVNIASIHFLLGVDSTHNVSGVQTGALDPAKGMFWTWNSGYVMAKLEGTSNSSKIAGHRFTYHVGGFREGMNTAKMITLKTGNIQPGSILNITADINHWFKSNTDLLISETPVCHSPGTLALRIADNYSGMFSVNPVAQ